MPANCTAIGKVMLAHSPAAELACEEHQLPRLTTNSIAEPDRLKIELKRIRRVGIAYDRQEAAVGLTCVGAPIISSASNLIGAISVGGPIKRFHPTSINLAVRSAAASIARAMATA
jgi:DNA-binding IclR family transcriptional regulator